MSWSKQTVLMTLRGNHVHGGRQLDKFKPQELSNLIWASARLGHQIDGNIIDGVLQLTRTWTQVCQRSTHSPCTCFCYTFVWLCALGCDSAPMIARHGLSLKFRMEAYHLTAHLERLW